MVSIFVKAYTDLSIRVKMFGFLKIIVELDFPSFGNFANQSFELLKAICKIFKGLQVSFTQ